MSSATQRRQSGLSISPTFSEAPVARTCCELNQKLSATTSNAAPCAWPFTMSLTTATLRCLPITPPNAPARKIRWHFGVYMM